MPEKLLTDRAIRNAKPAAKPYRLADGGNLYLYVAATGAKSWQFRYRLDGDPQTETLGKFPRMTLEAARGAAEKSRKLAATGEHLTASKRASKAKRIAQTKTTFAIVAGDWIASEAKRGQWSPRYRAEVDRSIRNHLGALDRAPLVDVTAPIVAPLLRAVENTAPHMLEKVRRRLNAILDYAVEQGDIPGNPLPRTKRRKKSGRKHYPAVTDLAGVGAILRAAAASDPCKGIQRAHALLAFTAQRVSEVVGATLEEFDLDGGAWSIPRERMKRKDEDRGPHVVPLPAGLLASLREWRKVDGQRALYVCPAPRDARKPITAEAVEKHYRNALELGGKHSPHSWRSAFSTIARDAGKESGVVEAQLDHVVGNSTAAAYDRALRLELRRKLMAWYERQLIAARDGAAVIAIKRAEK